MQVKAPKKTTESNSCKVVRPNNCDFFDIIKTLARLAPSKEATQMISETHSELSNKHLFFGDYPKLISFLEFMFDEKIELEFCYFEEFTDVFFGLPKSDLFINLKIDNENLKLSYKINGTYTDYLIDMGRVS